MIKYRIKSETIKLLIHDPTDNTVFIGLAGGQLSFKDLTDSQLQYIIDNWTKDDTVIELDLQRSNIVT